MESSGTWWQGTVAYGKACDGNCCKFTLKIPIAQDFRFQVSIRFQWQPLGFHTCWGPLSIKATARNAYCSVVWFYMKFLQSVCSYNTLKYVKLLEQALVPRILTSQVATYMHTIPAVANSFEDTTTKVTI